MNPKDIENPIAERDIREQFNWDETIKENRLKEQKQKKDYNNEMEKCECGTYLNSHDHCPKCDY